MLGTTLAGFLSLELGIDHTRDSKVAQSCGQRAKAIGMIRWVPFDADTPRHPWLSIRNQSAGQGTAPQMYFAYSAIDRSLENLQDRMTLSAAILAQSERFR